MNTAESKDYTERLERAAITLMRLSVFRKPDDLARRFELPLPVVRHWWRQTDESREKCDPIKPTTNEVKRIRRASQTLEGWRKTKRYRPQCEAILANGRRCKTSVAIRQPEGWGQGCLASRCRMHGGMARRVLRTPNRVLRGEVED